MKANDHVSILLADVRTPEDGVVALIAATVQLAQRDATSKRVPAEVRRDAREYLAYMRGDDGRQ